MVAPHSHPRARSPLAAGSCAGSAPIAKELSRAGLASAACGDDLEASPISRVMSRPGLVGLSRGDAPTISFGPILRCVAPLDIALRAFGLFKSASLSLMAHYASLGSWRRPLPARFWRPCAIPANVTYLVSIPALPAVACARSHHEGDQVIPSRPAWPRSSGNRAPWRRARLSWSRSLHCIPSPSHGLLS